MKQNIRRVFLLLCTVTCLLSMAACSKGNETVETMDPMITASMEQMANSTLEQLDAATPQQIQDNLKTAEKQGDSVVFAAMQSWESLKGDLGNLVSVDSVQVSTTDEGDYLAVAQTTFENRKMVMRMGIKEDLSGYSLLSFTPEYTVGEKMSKAGMNTLMGMGTVFTVLIFISQIIRCFKYINAWEKKQKAAAAAPAATPQAVFVPAETEPEENLADDMELAAVITAAIAAAEHTSADGLVVRSIRRVSSSKWKRA